MMIKPINIIQSNCVYPKRNDVPQTSSSEVSDEQIQLSGYEAGRAMLAQHKINFRGNSLPNDVTSLYNKKIEGVDHLDLPNVSIYEYPDTNLKVFVNADENLTTDSLGINAPKIILEQSAIDEKKVDLVKSKLIHNIMSNQINRFSDDADAVDVDSSFMYYSMYMDNPLDKQKDINKIVSDLKFSANELEDAKKRLKDYLNSSEYQDSIKITKNLYNSDEVKSIEELNKEIDTITEKALMDYYEQNKKNSELQIFMTISKKDFDENKQNILRALNSGISGKYCKVQEDSSAGSEFVPNNQIKSITGANKFKKCYFSVKQQDSRDGIIGEFATKLIDCNSDIIKISSKNYITPIGLKKGNSIKHHYQFYQMNFDKKTGYEDYQKEISRVCSLDLSKTLEVLKNDYKERMKEVFIDDNLSEIKSWELCSYSDSIFGLYEAIDSIQEEDIKEYIVEYFIKQKPITE